MDRIPLPAPYPVGTVLRYVGTSRSWTQDADGNDVMIVEPGMIVTVDKVQPGRRGTLRPLPGAWDDDDEPVLDRTTDGYSTYSVEVLGYRPCGRIIWPANAAEWERV